MDKFWLEIIGFQAYTHKASNALRWIKAQTKYNNYRLNGRVSLCLLRIRGCNLGLFAELHKIF